MCVTFLADVYFVEKERERAPSPSYPKSIFTWACLDFGEGRLGVGRLAGGSWGGEGLMPWGGEASPSET